MSRRPLNGLALSVTLPTYAARSSAGWFDQPLDPGRHSPANGSKIAPWLWTVKWRCGPLELPLEAVSPICAPAGTHCPFLTLMLRRARWP